MKEKSSGSYLKKKNRRKIVNLFYEGVYSKLTKGGEFFETKIRGSGDVQSGKSTMKIVD